MNLQDADERSLVIGHRPLVPGHRPLVTGYQRGSAPGRVPHSRSLQVSAFQHFSISAFLLHAVWPPSATNHENCRTNPNFRRPKLHFSCLFLFFPLSLLFIHEALVQMHFLRDAILTSSGFNSQVPAPNHRFHFSSSAFSLPVSAFQLFRFQVSAFQHFSIFPIPPPPPPNQTKSN